MRNQPADGFSDPYREDRAGISQLCKVLCRYPGRDFLQGAFRLVGSEPGEGAHDVAGGPVRRHELPAGRVTQLHPLVAKLELPGWAGSEVYRSHRNLFSESQDVRRSSTRRHDDVPPQHRESGDNFVNFWWATAEPGLNGVHVDAPAEPHESAAARQARQGLVDNLMFSGWRVLWMSGKPTLP